MNFEQLLRFGVDQQASDIHLLPGSPPGLRIGGQLRTVEGQLIPHEGFEAFLKSIVPPELAEDLDSAAAGGAVFVRTIDGVGRFRGTLSRQLGLPGLVLRAIPASIGSIAELNLPPVVQDVALGRRGLTLVTGTGGSGKTRTLAAMVDLINSTVTCKIVTVEDPVEYVHSGKKSLVAQRRVGRDAASFEEALAAATREDADVLVIGDLRDAGSLRLALRAAESGQQVLAALHGNGAVQAVERLVAMLPPDDRRIGVAQLTGTLEAAIALRMAANKDGGRRPVVEVLRGGPMTTRSILEGRYQDLSGFLASRQGGMQQFDQHLLELYQSGVISGIEAMRLATNPEGVAADLRNLRRKASA